jgi:hypothetical protein
MANALTLLRFLARAEDQAVAKIMLTSWDPLCKGSQAAAEDYENRCLDFLKGEIYYPEEVGLFEVLDRMDLRSYRQLEPCCKTQIGFIESLLSWADECWPQTQREAQELENKMRESLADEASYLRRQALKSQAALERAALLA